MSDHIIEATGVRKLYDTGRHGVEALAGVDLTVRRGEVVAVMGSSGCGRTTLLNCPSGLDTIDGGRVRIAGQDLRDLTDNPYAATLITTYLPARAASRVAPAEALRFE